MGRLFSQTTLDIKEMFTDEHFLDNSKALPLKGYCCVKEVRFHVVTQLPCIPYPEKCADLPIRHLYAWDVPLWFIDSLSSRGITTIKEVYDAIKTSKLQGMIIEFSKQISQAYFVDETVDMLVKAMVKITQGINNNPWRLEIRLTGGRDTRLIEVLQRRMGGETLEVIGQSLGITRERVRQIEKKALALINDFLAHHGTAFLNRTQRYNHLVDEELAIILLGQDGWEMVKYAVQNQENSNWFWWEGPNLLLVKVDDMFHDVLLRMEQDIIKGCNDDRSIDQCMDVLYKEGYRFITRAILEEHIKKKGFRRYGDILQQRKMSIREAVAYLAEYRLNLPIRMTDPSALDELRTLLADMGMEYSGSDRALWSIACDVLVLCGRGSYTAPNRVLLPEALGEDICRYVEEMPEDCIDYSHLFHVFYDRLFAESNVHNHHFLHGALMLRYPNRFIYKRDLLVKLDAEIDPTNVYHLLADFLLEAGAPVPKQRIFEHFPGWTDIRLSNAQAIIPEIIGWGYGTYINANLLRVDEADKQRLMHTIDSVMKYTDGIIGSIKAYYELKIYTPDILQSNGVENERQCFQLLAFFFGEEYTFAYPYILKYWDSDKQFTHMDCIRACLRDNVSFNREALYAEMIQRFGTETSGLRQTIQSFVSECLPMGEDEYLLPSVITQDSLEELVEVLRGLIDTCGFVLPYAKGLHEAMTVLKIPWTPQLLCVMTEKYLHEYRIVRDDHFEECCAIVAVDSPLTTWQEVAIAVKNLPR